MWFASDSGNFSRILPPTTDPATWANTLAFLMDCPETAEVKGAALHSIDFSTNDSRAPRTPEASTAPPNVCFSQRGVAGLEALSQCRSEEITQIGKSHKFSRKTKPADALRSMCEIEDMSKVYRLCLGVYLRKYKALLDGLQASSAPLTQLKVLCSALNILSFGTDSGRLTCSRLRPLQGVCLQSAVVVLLFSILGGSVHGRLEALETLFCLGGRLFLMMLVARNSRKAEYLIEQIGRDAWLYGWQRLSTRLLCYWKLLVHSNASSVREIRPAELCWRVGQSVAEDECAIGSNPQTRRGHAAALFI